MMHRPKRSRLRARLVASRPGLRVLNDVGPRASDMICPICQNLASDKSCGKCGAIFVSLKRAVEIDAIRNATMNMTSAEIKAWTHKLNAA